MLLEQKGLLMNTKSRVAGAFMGLAIGDALGVPMENKRKGSIDFVSEMLGGGANSLPPGAWTDKTAIALCLAQSLLVTSELDVYDLVTRLKKWVETGENSSTGICTGVEQNLLRWLRSFQRKKQIDMGFPTQPDDGKSVIARVCPVACIHWTDLATVSRISRQQSYLTHTSEIIATSCEYLALSVSHLIAGRDWNYVCNMPMKKDWPYEIRRIIEGTWRYKKIHDLNTSDGIVDLLEAAFWCSENSTNYEEAVTTAINLGGSSETIGSVVGQIAGAMYGLESIPVRWFDQLVHVEKLTDVAMEMVDLSRSE